VGHLSLVSLAGGTAVFDGLFVVLVMAALAPLIVGFLPWIPLPDPVLEIILGIVVGPSVLGWARPDGLLAAVSSIGLAFLLFLAGLELDLARLRGELLLAAALGMTGSVVVCLPVIAGLRAGALAQDPLLVGVILLATSLGLILPLVSDAGLLDSKAGQLVIAGSSLGEVSAVVALSLFFSVRTSPLGGKLIVLTLLLALAAALALTLGRAERQPPVTTVLDRLTDTTAQIRVRLSVLLLVGLAAAADRLGFEAILGAFLAGAVLRLIDKPADGGRPQLQVKLSGIGYGFLVPVFFVYSGVTFDIQSLLRHPVTLARVPVFLLALLVVRCLPSALVYRRQIGARAAAGAGLLQSVSLPLIVVGTQIGLRLHLMVPANAAALVAAGLLSVIVFPIPGLRLLRGTDGPTGQAAKQAPPDQRTRLCSQLTQAVNLRRR
jgi:Kef-type K+ transport system membrane component KefB